MRAESPPQWPYLGGSEVVRDQSEDQRHDFRRESVYWPISIDHPTYNLEPLAYNVVESLKLLVQKSIQVIGRWSMSTHLRAGHGTVNVVCCKLGTDYFCLFMILTFDQYETHPTPRIGLLEMCGHSQVFGSLRLVDLYHASPA